MVEVGLEGADDEGADIVAPRLDVGLLEEIEESSPQRSVCRLLLARAADYVARRSPGVASVPTGDEIDWLPEVLRAPARDLIARGLRLPQELVGGEALDRETSATDAR